MKTLSAPHSTDRTPDATVAACRVQGRFNTFQTTMLQWNSVHPYNAVHVVRIPGTPDPQRLRLAIHGTLEARALTGWTLNQDQGTYVRGGSATSCDIRDIQGAENPRMALALEMERQLNTPFLQTGPFTPFRFFVAPGEDSLYLGLAYLHAVADAESVVLLLREIFETYTRRNAQGGQGHRTAADILPPPQGNLLFSHPGVFARKLAALPSLLRNLRRSCRPSYRDATDLNNGFKLFSLEPKRLRCLLEAGGCWGVTVNDVLLALLMKSCARLATGRARAARRNKISIGCIVNTRKDLGGKVRGAFGLFLGSFVITHAVPEAIPLRELATDIGRLTREIKRTRIYLATPLELSLARFMLSFFSTERRRKLYQKHYPLWGGLTNMNIHSLWRPQEGDEPIDYIRAVSTGPATPLVLSFTTAGQGANLGLSHRSTVFTASDIERLMSCFLETIADLEVRT